MAEATIRSLGKYEILQEIGKGGFATVYRARDTTLDREVAIKVLHPQLLVNPSFVQRFQREARSLASLRHPHIVTIYEVGEAEGRLFIAMELARGPSLAQASADRGCIPWDETLALLKPVCEALDYAHGQGVIHRDLKPANILLDGERGPMLTDFGFARLVGESSASLSLSGGILGTPAYIAPEVWELDAAGVPADVYALGCIVYEMLTGEVLFAGQTPMQVMRAHDRGPALPESWTAGVPEGTPSSLIIALARDSTARYQSPGLLWHALHDLGTQAPEVHKAGEQVTSDAQSLAGANAARQAQDWNAANTAKRREATLPQSQTGSSSQKSHKDPPRVMSIDSAGKSPSLVGVSRGRVSESRRRVGMILCLLLEVVGLFSSFEALWLMYSNSYHYARMSEFLIYAAVALVGMSFGIIVAYRLGRQEAVFAVEGIRDHPPGVWPIAAPMILTGLGVLPVLGLLRKRSWGRVTMMLFLILFALVWIVGMLSLAGSVQEAYGNVYSSSCCRDSQSGFATGMMNAVVVTFWCGVALFYLASSPVKAWFQDNAQRWESTGD